MIITIDGPAASGKSTVAQKLAQEFDYYYLYSGLLYRAVAYLLIRNYPKYAYNIELFERPPLSDIQAIINPHYFEYHYHPAYGAWITYAGEKLTELKTSAIDHATSILSASMQVRASIIELQRSIAQKNNLVAEGRDCGTVVFPQAEYKFFLTACQQVRATRWQQDQCKAGKNFSWEFCYAAIVDRDKRDETRAHSPLVIPAQAQLIDNSNLDLKQTIVEFKKHIQSL